MNTFMQQGCIKLFESDIIDSDIKCYKSFLFQINAVSFELSILYPENKNVHC